MRKSEKILKSLTKNQTHNIPKNKKNKKIYLFFFKKKNLIFQKVGTAVPTHQPNFFFFFP